MGNELRNNATVMSRDVNISEPIVGYPISEGLYLYKCMETDDEWFYVAICEDKYGLLFIYDEFLGKTYLNEFCDGLTDIVICKVN